MGPGNLFVPENNMTGTERIDRERKVDFKKMLKGFVLNQIYGLEASRKTTLALHVISEAREQGVEAIGVNTRDLLLSQPDWGEQALSLVDTIIKSGSVDVVVVYSVAALVPKSELDGEMGDAHMAMQARIMSHVLRKLRHSLSKVKPFMED
ncbi:hypothetical protein L1887_18915 [Cichorium endivia]|nr:hypothetical protein L1887_18915 [Cichorium endivia]